METSFFGNRRPGPEMQIEDSLLENASSVFPNEGFAQWVGGSLNIGASKPDLLFASWRPELRDLPETSTKGEMVLAYLRFVYRAKVHTIAERIPAPDEAIEEIVYNLYNSGVLIRVNNSYLLADPWKDVLPRITAIEAKVSNWRRAVLQAARNTIFAQRSFVALPSSVAFRASRDAYLRSLGIGVIAIDNLGNVEIVRNSRRFEPKVWHYYYRIASTIANEVGGQ